MSFESAQREQPAIEKDVRVLVVDDDEGARLTLEDALETDGYGVKTAANGPEALAVLQKSAYDIALLDVGLPGMSGIELLQRLKERDPHLPCVMVTGQAAMDVAVDALDKGADYFVTKPIEPPALLKLVGHLVEKRRLQERERRSTHEARTLSQVAQEMVRSLDLKNRLPVIARTLSEVAGCTRCLVFLRRDEAWVPQHAYGLGEHEGDTFEAMGTDLLALGGPIKRAVESREPLCFRSSESDPLESRLFLSLWRARCGLVLPLVIESEVVGAALVYTPDEDHLPDPRDVELCEAVANQAAVAIENARVFERERNIAEVLQQSFLPPVPEELGSLRLAGRYYAALAEAHVGGDFYDIIEFADRRIGLLIADVSGKGVSAAVHAAMGKYMLRAFAFEHRRPADALASLNAALFAFSSHEAFITMFFGVVDPSTGEMEYVNAGHPPAVLARGRDRNRLVRLGSTAPPVGALRDSRFSQDAIRVEPGDTLVLYTDGVTEARSGRELFGIERLEDVLAANPDKTPGDLADAIHRAVREFSGRSARDDIALIVAEAEPAGWGK